MKENKLMLVFFIPFIMAAFPIMLYAKEAAKNDKVNTGFGVTQNHELEHFETINLSGLGALYIKQSTSQSLSVEADESILPLIKVSVVNKVLNIEMRDASKHDKAKITYHLNVKQLKDINLFGNSAVYIEEGFNSHTLNLLVSSLGEAHIKKLNVDKLNVKMASGATVEAAGVADQQTITINGAGEFDGSKLSGQVASVNINDMGVAKVNVSNSLMAAIIGEGTVQYCGSPNVKRQADSNAAVISPLSAKDCK